MKLRFVTIGLLVFLFAIGLAGCDLSLAGDVTPPPGMRVPTAAAPQATASIVYPVVPPDPTQGAALYAEKCAACHGAGGKGDGSQASQLPIPVTPLGSVDVARLVKPINWFTIITQGKIERMMPPFKSLTDRQRWDLVAYLFTLSTPQQVLADGKSVYEANCQSCHGSQGAGNGEKAASLSAKVPNWRDLTRLAQLSAKELVTVVNNGAGQAMPAYASQLSEEQRWAVVAYIRSLTFASAATPATSATTSPTVQAAAKTPAAETPVVSSTPAGTASAPLTKVNFVGKVTHATGKPLPQGLKVVLQGFDSMTKASESTTEVQADGTYQFKDVELGSGRVFVASLTYQNVEFTSATVHGSDLGSSPDVDLSITVTDSSTDASVLAAQRVHIFLDFTLDGRIQVAELFVVINPTENAVVPVDAKTPGLLFDLPNGATNLQFQDGELGERFIQTVTGFGDTMEVLPKAMHQVLFGFDLPYENNKTTIKIPFTLPVDSLVVMVPADGVTLESPSLRSSGTRQIDNANINLFSGSNFARGSVLELTVSGQPSAGTPTIIDTSSTSSLLIGLGVFGVVLIVVGVWLFRQKKKQDQPVEEMEEEESPEENEDALLDAIVALDDLYQAGKLPEVAYQERRSELKARLKALREAKTTQ